MKRAVTILITLASLIWSSVTMAEDTRLTSLQTGDDARGWEAVGRLDMAGKGFCTGALISDTLVLTAAHCLFQGDTDIEIDPELITFQVGLRNGRALATRQIRRQVVHPEYNHTGQVQASEVPYDIALLELAQPVRLPSIQPFRTAPGVPRGTDVGVVSYAHDRAEAPSLQRICSVLDTVQGVVVMSCDVDYGSSGAPVFLTSNGVTQIVSVVSASGNDGTQDVSLGVSLSGTLDLLRAEMNIGRGTFVADAPSQVRVLRPGETANTGARFLTVGQ